MPISPGVTVEAPSTVPDSVDSRDALLLAKTGGAKAVARRLLCFPVLLGVLLVAGVIISVRSNLPDPDTWYHAVAGEEVLATHAWPTVDRYSFTAYGRDSMTLEWLGDVLIAEAARLGDLLGMMLLLAALSSALMILLYYYASLRSGNSKASFAACVLLVPLVSGFCHLRPQVLGYIFFLITLICLEHFRRGRQRALWVLPPLFAIWVNVHGTFIFGFLALGLYWASGLAEFRWGGIVAERWTKAQHRQLILTILGCALTLPLTPYGTRLAVYTVHVIRHAPLGMSNITEYQPLGSYPSLLKMFLALFLPFLLAQVILRPSYRLDDMVLFVAAAYGACVHARLLFFFALIFAPLLAFLLPRWIDRYEPAKDRYVLNAIIVALIGLGLVKSFPSRSELRQQISAEYPQKAVDYLREHPVAGSLLNDYGWGGYLIWAYPERKVFIDGRSQLYEDSGVYADYLRLMGVEKETLTLLTKYDLQGCLLRRESPLVTFLEALPDWDRVYSDKVSAIMLRRKRS